MAIFIFALLFAIGPRAFAESSSISAPSITFKLTRKAKRKIRAKVRAAQGKGFDHEVTDIQMRAASGAQTKFSSSYMIHYWGPAINDLGSGNRPLIGGIRQQSPVSVDGDIGLRYRFNENDSLFLAVGLYKSDPLHTSEASKPMTVNTPQINFNSTRRVAGVEVASDTVAYITTIPWQLKYNQIGKLAEYVTFLKSIGLSRFDTGAWVNVSYTAYGNERVSNLVASKQNDFDLVVAPTLDFRPTRNTKLWSSIGLVNLMHYRSNPGFSGFTPQALTGYFGLGVAIVRNLYVDPYVQFEPTQMALNKTIFNLSSDMNF